MRQRRGIESKMVDRDEAKRLILKEGLTFQQASERLGVSRQRISQIVGKTGRPRRSKDKATLKLEANLEKHKEEVFTGKRTVNQIAEEYGISSTTVSVHLQKFKMRHESNAVWCSICKKLKNKSDMTTASLCKDCNRIRSREYYRRHNKSRYKLTACPICGLRVSDYKPAQLQHRKYHERRGEA
jgi:transcriptional regulator with XRE-family HTH domain